MRNIISSVCISHCIHTVLSSMTQTLVLAEHKLSTLNHPNIWLLTSLNQQTEAVAMPRFSNGNIIGFMAKNSGINKLVIVFSLICL